MQTGDSWVSMSPTSKSRSASWSRYSCAQPEAALRDQADAAPLAVADLEDVVDQLPATRGFPSRRTARAYWFSTSARPSSSCRTVAQHALRAGRAARSR